MSSQAKLKPVTESRTLESKAFDVEIKNNIAHLRMNRPDTLNTMTPDFWNELPRLVRQIDGEALARVIVISAEGKHFCAGMDLAVFASIGSTPETTEAGRKRSAMYTQVLNIQKGLSTLDEARIPVLAAIQGAAVGGAVDLISACDMRYCTKDSFFCIHEINIGMTADVGTFPRLPHLMPQGLVRELAYTGRRLYAEEAHRVGFVNRVFDTSEDVLNGTMEIAGEIAQRSPLAVWGSKHMINEGRGRTIAEGLDRIALWQSGMFGTDIREGLTAQQEKRAPDYQNLLPLPDKDKLI